MWSCYTIHLCVWMIGSGKECCCRCTGQLRAVWEDRLSGVRRDQTQRGFWEGPGRGWPFAGDPASDGKWEEWQRPNNQWAGEVSTVNRFCLLGFKTWSPQSKAIQFVTVLKKTSLTLSAVDAVDGGSINPNQTTHVMEGWPGQLLLTSLNSLRDASLCSVSLSSVSSSLLSA